MIVFRNIFCYAGWKSLHIPIAIIKLSGLNVFIYSVEGVGPRNVRPLTFLPACQHVYLHTSAHPVHADRTRHQCVHVHYADRARMAGKHQQPDLPSWYCCSFINCAIKFSHQLMT